MGDMALTKKIILLRGVMPVGKNKIPKMAYLVEILENVGLYAVKSYIQSGNVICETDLPDAQLAQLVHETIKTHIGADLSVIIKTADQFEIAIAENPFDTTYDCSRIHLIFTNDDCSREELAALCQRDFGDEKFAIGEECLYMYLPRDAKKKRLNNNYLEKQLQMISTMRKLSVISRLYEIATEKEKL